MGLIKTGLKAAVAVKTAHYVHDRIQRRQQAEWAAQGQPTASPGTAPPPSPSIEHWTVQMVAAAAGATPSATPPGAGQDRSAVLSQLKDLAELKAAGVLTDDEVAQQKALILGG
jgi:hypothetical protein